MSVEIEMQSLVALLEQLPARHFETGAPLTLPSGQMGTVVMTYNGTTFEVEFADAQGRTFAIRTIPLHSSSCCTTRLRRWLHEAREPECSRPRPINSIRGPSIRRLNSPPPPEP